MCLVAGVDFFNHFNQYVVVERKLGLMGTVLVRSHSVVSLVASL